MTAKKRPWSVTALAILSLLEAVMLLNLGSFKMVQLIQIKENNIFIDLAPIGIFSISLSVLALFAAIGFLRLWKSAWINAMLVQGLVILYLLMVHFTQQITHLVDYGVMTFAIFIVVYLNYNEVQLIFRVRDYPEDDQRKLLWDEINESE